MSGIASTQDHQATLAMLRTAKADQADASARFSITVCICTSGRPIELQRCLASLAGGSRLPAHVIVSDDSRDAAIAQQIRETCDGFSFVQYTPGPRRGLCANRNHVIRQAKTSHVSLLDDDAVASADFIEHAEKLLQAHPGQIITGDVMENGTHRSAPTNSTFLGHFGRPVKAGERLENVNLNCNIFPRQAFETAMFDESIIYGYEDTDLCARLLAVGWNIRYASELMNEHLPPLQNKIDLKNRSKKAEEARVYVTLRRYVLWDVSPTKAILFSVLAPIHGATAALKYSDFWGIGDTCTWVVRSIRKLHAIPCRFRHLAQPSNAK